MLATTREGTTYTAGNVNKRTITITITEINR